MLRPIYVHCKPDQGYDDRFDTVMNVNGSVAVLNSLTRQVLGYSGLAIDESYPGPGQEGTEREYVLQSIRQQIEKALRAGDEPVLYCTLLSYNAGNTLALLKQLKDEYGKRLRTGVGGQLTSVYPGRDTSPWVRLPFVDQVSVGDAEITLAAMLLGRNWYCEGTKRVHPEDHYAPPHYGNYLGLTERLDEMAEYNFCGAFSGMRQLITESVRGCAWAHARRRCKFCALIGVNDIPLFRDFAEHFAIERRLADKYRLNWLFDVSNQWLPTMIPRLQVEWLRQYIAARKAFNGPDINRYVYLTTNSITKQTAPLLREAGVRIVYVGIDGWDNATKAANYKTLASTEAMLEACRANGIYVRTSLVIGSGLTPQNLDELPRFVADLLARYGGSTILSLGNFLEIVLPGSDDWDEFHFLAHTEGIDEAQEIFTHFRTEGYITLEQQDKLNELRIRYTQDQVEYQHVVAARDAAVEIVKRSSALSVTFRECDKLKRKE
jgi:hypothetical protein